MKTRSDMLPSPTLNRRSWLKLAAALPLALPAVSWKASPARADGTEIVGTVSKLTGNAVAMQNAIPRPLAKGQVIQEGDVLSTGPGSKIEVAMIDGGVLQLGEGAIFIVMEYVYGATKENKAIMRLMEGAFAVTSGKIKELASNEVRVETEFATIGIRGTTVWGGVLSDTFEVALIEGTAVDVTTRAGTVLLDKVGTGTALPSLDEAPESPVDWGPEKIAQATATVRQP
ncbi:MAG: FecR family protein [Magnetovibrionaceae bacterium]